MSLSCPLFCRREHVDVEDLEDHDVMVGSPRSGRTRSRHDKVDKATGVSMRAALLIAVASAAGSSFVTSALHRAVPPSGARQAALSDLQSLDAELPPASPPEADAAATLPAEALFAELSVAEVRAVAQFTAQKLGCNTAYVRLSSCFLSGAEAVKLKLPEKAAVLGFLDGSAAAPKRMAQVTVAHGEKPVAEGTGLYEVGPLDGNGGLASDAAVTLVRSLHWNYRPLQMDEASWDPAVTKSLKQIQGLLLSSFGPIFPNLNESFDPSAGTAVYWTGANVYSSLARRSSRFWFNWFQDPDEFQLSWLHTLPFNFDMSHAGPPEDWIAVNVSYCGQRFPTIQALVAAESAGKVWRCNGTQHTDYSWDVPGPNPGPGAHGKFPPSLTSSKAVAATPARSWKMSPRGSTHWGDWKFLATLRPSSGLALHDVRFRGERVLYELSLNDCHAYYAGPSPEKQYHFSDKAYSLAQLSGDLVAGLDCPEGASFLESAMWVEFFRNGSSRSDPSQARGFKLVCVFESNGFEGSSWRHSQLINRQVTGRPQKMLVVRAIGTVGNYDYITDVRLSEDGGVHVSEAFAGYPEVDRHFKASEPDWGTTVHSQDAKRGKLVQNLHSHYCAFKVDLDIAGLQNEFHASKITHGAGEAGQIGQKVQESRRVEAEDPSEEFVANARTPGLWRIVNPKALNKRNGLPRGYAMVVGNAPSVHSYGASHPFAASATFARRHLAVTQRKEEEPEATSIYDFYAVPDPLYSIDSFLSDRESLVEKDLVCWVSVGKEHAAREEDQPLITNFAVEFSLLPWNFHQENPEMALAMAGKGPEELLSDHR